jgi:hypothetical protein
MTADITTVPVPVDLGYGTDVPTRARDIPDMFDVHTYRLTVSRVNDPSTGEFFVDASSASEARALALLFAGPSGIVADVTAIPDGAPMELVASFNLKVSTTVYVEHTEEFHREVCSR